MASICARGLWNMNRVDFRLLSTFRVEAQAVEIPAIDEEDGFSTETDDERQTNNEMQRMILSALHVFEETALKHHIEDIMETKVTSFLENVAKEADKGESLFVRSCGECCAPRFIS